MVVSPRDDEWWAAFWNNIYLYATAVAAAFGIIALLATRFGQQYSGRVNSEQKKHIAEVDLQQERLKNENLQLQSTVEQERSARIADSKKKNSEIAATQLRAANAEERAAKNELAAAKLRLELEKMKQPRRLSADQKMRLRAFLTVQTKPTRYVPCAAPDKESLDLMRNIGEVLQLAGWTAFMPEGPGMNIDGILINAQSGMSLAVHRNRTENTWLSAQLLTLLLRDECKLEPTLYGGIDDTTVPNDCVLIMCGTKPL